MGFPIRKFSPGQAEDLINFFKTAKVPATVLGGVPTHWRFLDGDSLGEPEWATIYRSLDIISPWTVGVSRTMPERIASPKQFLIPDLAETRRLGSTTWPVAWPGFSWHNGAGRASNSPLNAIPRRCGGFYQHQIDNMIKAGVDMLYTAMFDEPDEGTAIFKMAVHSGEVPEGVDIIPLDFDDCHNAANDTYLQLAGEASRALRRPP